jgi:hypothetical protein
MVRIKSPPERLGFSNLYFDHGIERVQLLHIGSHITVVGQISKIDQYGFYLEQCELISVDSP